MIRISFKILSSDANYHLVHICFNSWNMIQTFWKDEV